MTAYLPTEQLEKRDPAALPDCTHSRLSFGLDRAYCPDCRCGFSPSTPEYKALLAGVQQVLTANATEIVEALIDCRDSVETIEESTSVGSDERSERPPEDSSTRPPEHSKKHTPASGWVEKYIVKRRWEYYRYCWQTSHKGKINRLHIPSDSGKLAAVREAISGGCSPQEISQLLKKCSGGRSFVMMEQLPNCRSSQHNA